jgi:GNAT superfamily N-acetyltransferase
MNIEVSIADYSNDQHSADLVHLLSCYALDPMGGGTALSEFVLENLVSELSKLPHAISVICYADGKPAGLVNCFEGFSTFKCKPLINIHDVVVLDEFRGLGISQLMLERIEEIAKEKGCCKMTLEVLEGNKTARNAYLKYGFEAYELAPENGKALFWQKTL